MNEVTSWRSPYKWCGFAPHRTARYREELQQTNKFLVPRFHQTRALGEYKRYHDSSGITTCTYMKGSRASNPYCRSGTEYAPATPGAATTAAAPATLFRTSRRELALSAVQAEAEAERSTMAAANFILLVLFVGKIQTATDSNTYEPRHAYVPWDDGQTTYVLPLPCLRLSQFC